MRLLVLVSIVIAVASASERADAGPAVIREYCVDCHYADAQEGGVRLDQLLDDLNPGDGATLVKVRDVLRRGVMPPDDAGQPSDEERSALSSWIDQQLPVLREVARAQRPARTRRMTVEEYNVTMQALFGVDARFDDLLPEDPVSESGYRNNSEQLGITTIQWEAYLESARRAVSRYVRFDPNIETPLRYYVELEDQYYSTARRYDTLDRAPKPIDAEQFAKRQSTVDASAPRYLEPLGPALPGAYSEEEEFRPAIPKLNEHYVAYPARMPVGELVVHVRAAGTADRDGRFPRMRVQAGISLGDGCSVDKKVMGEVDVTAPMNAPRSYSFRMRLEDVPSKGPLRPDESFDRLSVFDMDQIFVSNVSPDAKAVFALGRGAYADAEKGSAATADAVQQMMDANTNLLHLDSVAIEVLPGVGFDNESYRWTISLPAEDGADRANVVRETLTEFMPTAYRRPVTEPELQSKINLFEAFCEQGLSPQDSLRETLAAVLVSPSFLYLQLDRPDESAPESNAAYRLASQLSYLIWMSPPDEMLLQSAADQSLLRRDVLEREARRLLTDPRSQSFLDSFCRQWLRLDRHATIAVNRSAYPSYDADLAAASVREPLETFAAVFESDASALDLLNCDYAILNDRLAQHYGVSGVTQGEFARVALPAQSVRGGLLTQSGPLTIGSDGVDSHPIRRGVWLLDRIMHDPPPPPPPQVPQLDPDDPDFRGLTLKQQIELHRKPSSCAGCHRGIDPWGIALENFDATGRWRESVAAGDSETRIDSSTTLPDGQRIDHVTQLKQYLRDQRSDQFARSLVHHLSTYALGRAPDFADEVELDAIHDEFVASGYKLRSLVLAIIDSPLFHSRSATGGGDD